MVFSASSQEKLLKTISILEDRVEAEDLKLRNQLMLLKKHKAEREFRGGAEAIGGTEEQDSKKISTVIGIDC